MERSWGVGISTSEIEGLAVAFYERLGFDPAIPVDPFRLARKLLGPMAIERGTSVAGLSAKLFVVRGERRIAVSRKIPPEYAMFYVGHELGHVVLDEIGYREDDLETACDAFGAAVMAPMPAVRTLLRAFGRDHAAIAEEIGATQTWAALRVAECLGIPRAIITPGRLYVRGPEAFEWGPEDSLRRLARGRAGAPGITKVKLTDDPRRVVIDIDESDVG
jgi:hypothetical protein